MLPLHEAAATSAAAGLAPEMFCHSVRKQVAGILTAHVRDILREAQCNRRYRTGTTLDHVNPYPDPGTAAED